MATCRLRTRLFRNLQYAALFGGALLATPAPSAPIVDQSFTSPTSAGATFNDCCTFIAQTFTAGITGTLAGVNIDVLDANAASTSPLHVAIRTVTGDAPTTTILSEVTLGSGESLLSDLVVFPDLITIVAGTSYAIVVNYEGTAPTEGSWQGAAGDLYLDGTLWASVSDGISWFELGQGEVDLHFRTYVEPIPEPSTPLLVLEALLLTMAFARGAPRTTKS